jgi:CTP:molybdopterin cytidylyltransferase MocA
MTSARQDAVVILARGESTRMGKPKANLKLPGTPRTFLQMVVELYAGLAWPLTAVFGPAGRDGATVPAVVRVLTGPSGGDTALTMVTVWKADALAFAPPTHYWAHPVDLPLVMATTVAFLAEVSRRDPGSVIRPVFDGRPGHPVVVPRAVVRSAAADPGCRDLPFRKILDRHPAPIVDVPVEDAGVTRDFDEPDDLAAWRPEGVTK